MVLLRPSSLCLALVTLLPSTLACVNDPMEGNTATDTGTEDEIGDGDTTTAETGDGDTTTESGSTDDTDTGTTDTDETETDTTDAETTDAETTDTDTTDTDTTDTDTTDTDTTDTDTTDTDTTDTGDGDCAGICGTPECGECPDNGSVAIPGNYSIGSTEVANSDYEAFLAIGFTSEFLSGWLPAECDWKSDFTPDDWPANPVAELPVVNVDWCDAWAYCEWSGQHLCGAIGGGPAALVDVQNSVTNEWFKACTGGGVKNYPYGVDYVAAACNGLDAGAGQLGAVGSLMTCVGGYAGIYDMSGNVWEWENACAADPMVADEDQDCRQRGGSYFSDGPTLRCGIASVRARNYRNNNLGVRCCDTP